MNIEIDVEQFAKDIKPIITTHLYIRIHYLFNHPNNSLSPIFPSFATS